MISSIIYSRVVLIISCCVNVVHSFLLLRQTKRNEEKRREKTEEKTTEIFFIKKKSGEKSTKFNERNSVLVKLKHLTQHTILLRVLREKSRPNALKI